MNDTVVLKLRDSIALDDLSEILKELVDLQGCTACGFNGWDLNIRIDPEVRFSKLADRFREQVTAVDVLPALMPQISTYRH